MNFWFSLVILITIQVHATEYVYPVGHITKEQFSLLVLYQKSVHHLELWEWDPMTQELGKALLSTYTPAGIALLPNNTGFSFIDNDTIRIAHVHKRSPQLIPLYEPLYDFTTVTWVTDTYCLLSAKEKDHYGIYFITKAGQCYSVVKDGDNDYRYPTIFDNAIYCIAKQEDIHSIQKIVLDLSTIEQHKNVTAEEVFYAQDERATCTLISTQTLLAFDYPIAFLNMISENEGFFIEHQRSINRHDMRIMFHYHYFAKKDDTWRDITLFSFSIPAVYLLNKEERLYESLLPFLPKKLGDHIYFIDCVNNSITTQLYCYDLIHKNIQVITHEPSSCLGIYCYQATGWYGGALQGPISAINNGLALYENEQGALCRRLPMLSCKKALL